MALYKGLYNVLADVRTIAGGDQRYCSAAASSPGYGAAWGAVQKGGFLGGASWALGFPSSSPPKVRAGLGLARPRRRPAKKKTRGVRQVRCTLSSCCDWPLRLSLTACATRKGRGGRVQQAARLLCAHCLGLPGLPVGGACLVGAKITCICITSHEAPNSAPLTSSGVAARPAATNHPREFLVCRRLHLFDRTR